MVHREHISDRSAWRGSDVLADTSWEHHLGEADLIEIDHALAGVRDTPLSLITRDDFVVPGLQATLDAIGSELRQGRGFAMLRGLPVDRYELDDLERIYWGLCIQLGIGMTQNSDASLIHYVTDGVLRPNQGLRGVGSPKRSSLHVDLTDCASLLCVRQAPDSPPSWVASSVQVHNELLANHPESLEPLYKGFEWDRLDEQGPGESLTSGYRVPVFSVADGSDGEAKVSCRYNRYWMAKAIRRTAERLPDDVYELFNLFDEAADSIRLDVDFQPGDIQFINNYTVLHGRDAHDLVDDEDRKRLLMRIWLDFEQARPVADAATVRYGIVRHGSLGWTVDQYNEGLHQTLHPRDADGLPLVVTETIA